MHLTSKRHFIVAGNEELFVVVVVSSARNISRFAITRVVITRVVIRRESEIAPQYNEKEKKEKKDIQRSTEHGKLQIEQNYIHKHWSEFRYSEWVNNSCYNNDTRRVALVRTPMMNRD